MIEVAVNPRPGSGLPSHFKLLISCHTVMGRKISVSALLKDRDKDCPPQQGTGRIGLSLSAQPSMMMGQLECPLQCCTGWRGSCDGAECGVCMDACMCVSTESVTILAMTAGMWP